MSYGLVLLVHMHRAAGADEDTTPVVDRFGLADVAAFDDLSSAIVTAVRTCPVQQLGVATIGALHGGWGTQAPVVIRSARA